MSAETSPPRTDEGVDLTRAAAYCSWVREQIESWLTDISKTPALELQVAWGRQRLNELKGLPSIGDSRPLIAALLGGTGVGKSTLINAIFNQRELCATSRRRPTTERPKAIHHSTFNPAPLFSAVPTISFVDLPDELLERLILVDCPDFDAVTMPSAGGIRLLVS